MAPPLLTRSQFVRVRPQGNYQRYVGYVTQKRAQRAKQPSPVPQPWSAGPVVNGGAAATQAVIDRSTGMANVYATDPGAFNTGAGSSDALPPPPGEAPAVPPPPTTRKVAAHWTNPDWDALIRGNASFIAGQTALGAAKTSAATKRANAIKNAIIAFGGTPKNWTSGYGDLNETDIAKAQENPYSFMALANAQRGRSQADLMAELAGRGMLSSGALTGGQNMVQSSYDSGVAGGESSLLDTLGGYGSDYASTIGGLDRDWINTQSQIGAGIQAANPNQWIPEYEEPI